MTFNQGLLVKRLIDYALSSSVLMEAVRTAEACDLPDWRIVGGVIRDCMWSIVDGDDEPQDVRDIDLLYFDPRELAAEKDWEIEDSLPRVADIPWSVRNQARMHLRNNDAPYGSVNGALFCAPDTISAISISCSRNCDLMIDSCFGYEDLSTRVLRPTPYFLTRHSYAQYVQRVRTKGWLQKWPSAKVAPW